jgi:methyltransferase (TIGR00027 family)
VLEEQRATRRCERTAVPVDLREDWAAHLTGAGFDPGLPSAWTAEGLLAYLSNDEALRLLTGVGALSAPGSTLSFEYDDFTADSTLSQVRNLAGMEEVASMWEGGLRERPDAWLRANAWDVTTSARAALAHSYGRPLADGAPGGFVTATRN